MVADADTGDVSRQAFQVAYDGPGDTHSMDVQELAPALVAFGRLVREANAQLNGKHSTVKVLVVSDFEHKCFQINFEVVQTVLDHIATFLTSEEVKTAKQILTDLGIIVGPAGLGLLGFLKWKKSQKIAEIRDSDKQGIVIVQLGNGNVAQVSRDAVDLSTNPKIRAALEGTLAPLGTKNVDKIVFKEADHSQSHGPTFSEEDAKEIVAAFEIREVLEPVTDATPDTVTAWLRVYSPVYDEKAVMWRFFYGDHPIYADISETSIARDAIARGGSFVNDLYKVRMEVTQHYTEGGSLRPEYKIIRVLDFKPAPNQGDFFSGGKGALPSA